jgi:hypothetical protein
MFPIQKHRPALEQTLGHYSQHYCRQCEQGDFDCVFYPRVLREQLTQ